MEQETKELLLEKGWIKETSEGEYEITEEGIKILNVLKDITD